MKDIPVSVPYQLPGIDIAFGLKQCLGKQDLFQGLLQKFWQDYGNAADKLGSLSGYKEERQRLLHTLLGVSRNLGLSGISTLCQELRKDLDTFDNLTFDQIERLGKELEKVGNSINTLDSFS